MAQHTKNADNEVNNARRYVANHFFKIGILFKRRLLSKEIALLLVTVDQAKFIRVVLEPMERCIVGYDPSWYLALLNLHGLNPLVIENNIIPVDELRPLGLM